MVIVLCASVAFYEHVNQLASELSRLGFNPVVPKTAKSMQRSGDYNVSKTKTWYQNKDDFHLKKALMDEHFKEVAAGDALLIVNDTKHGVDGYVGANVLMEMAIGYFLKKPVYVLNNVSDKNSVYEEVMGMGCAQISGDLSKIAKQQETLRFGV